MVMLALSASLRTFATTYAAVEKSADRTARLREVTYFLRHVLREAYSPHQGAFHISGGETVGWHPSIAGAAGGVTWLRLRRAGDTVMLDCNPQHGGGRKSAHRSGVGDVIPQVLLEDVRRFQVKAIKAPSPNGYNDDDEALNDELPPGVQLEWELEGMSWPPLIVALDGYEMVQ